MKIKANDITMNCEISGSGDNLVLIHGGGDSLNVWYNQVPVFSKSCRVITYDIRGFGETESPEGEYSIPVFARDTYELMKAAGVEGACFLGHSLGGAVALQMALDYPEIVKALIFAAGFPGMTPPSDQPPSESLRLTVELMEKGDTERLAEVMVADLFSAEFRENNPGECEKYMKIKMRGKSDGMLRMMQPPSGAPAAFDLSRIKCPVLIIAGEKDSITPIDQVRKAHKAITGSRLTVLPAGHAVAIEAPEEFNSAVLDFLSKITDS